MGRGIAQRRGTEGTYLLMRPTNKQFGYSVAVSSIGLGMYGCGAAMAGAMPPTALALTAGVTMLGAGLGYHQTTIPDPQPSYGDLLGGDGDGGMYGGGVDMGQMGGNPNVVRLLQVVASVSEDIVPVPEDFSFVDNNEMGGDLESYGLRAMTPGYFASSSTQSRLYNVLSQALGDGWGIDFDTTTDTVKASRKSSLPKIALPEMWRVVRNQAEALEMYNTWALSLGPGESGETVTVNPQVYPHSAFIATSGGGKSVALRACIEQFRAIGGQVILGDGKGSDYASLRDLPGVITIGRGSGSRAMEYVGAIEIGYRIMQQRQNTAAERKLKDPAGWRNVPPVFIILDEMKSVMKKWKAELKKDFGAVESKVNQILALGREMRVHVFFATQDVYDQSIPNSWLTNVGMKINLGKPHSLTLTKGFDESIQGKARRIAASIDPKVRGRGMIGGVDEDSGKAVVQSYQGYYSYSPGEAITAGLPPEAQQNWPQFKAQVSDAVPRLYSRKWFKVDQMSEAQAKKESETGAELGYIDFELFSADEVANMPLVNLDMRAPDGAIVPDPDMVQYDPNPQNEYYVCRPVVNTATMVTDI